MAHLAIRLVKSGPDLLGLVVLGTLRHLVQTLEHLEIVLLHFWTCGACSHARSAAIEHISLLLLKHLLLIILCCGASLLLLLCGVDIGQAALLITCIVEIMY